MKFTTTFLAAIATAAALALPKPASEQDAKAAALWKPYCCIAGNGDSINCYEWDGKCGGEFGPPLKMLSSEEMDEWRRREAKESGAERWKINEHSKCELEYERVEEWVVERVVE